MFAKKSFLVFMLAMTSVAHAQDAIPVGTVVHFGYNASIFGSNIFTAPIDEVAKKADGTYSYTVKGQKFSRSEIALPAELIALEKFGNLNVGQEVIAKRGYGLSRDKLKSITKIGDLTFYSLETAGYVSRNQFVPVDEFQSITTDGKFSIGQEVFLKHGYRLYVAPISDIVRFGKEYYYLFNSHGYLGRGDFESPDKVVDLQTDGIRSVGQTIAIDYAYVRYQVTLRRIVMLQKNRYYLSDNFGFLDESYLARGQ